MVDLLKTSQQELEKSNLKNEKKKFWQQGAFFYHLIFPSIVSLILIIVTIAILVLSLPFWETILFPGLQKIDPLQRDLTILQSKVDHLTQDIQNIQDNGTEIETLKTQLSALQQTVTVLEKGSSKLSSSSPQPANELNSSQSLVNLHPLWEKLQKSLQSGEACGEEFNQLKSTIPSSLENALQPLAPFTESPAPPLSVLQTGLEKIYQTIKRSPSAEEIVVISQPDRWWHNVWDYLSKWIHIRPLNKKTTQVSLLTAVEKALESLGKNQLASAIEYLQSIHSVEGIRTWLKEAKRRQQCDQGIVDFGKELGGARQGGNG